MNQGKVRNRVLAATFVALAALFGVLICAKPAEALSGDTFTVVSHLTITLKSNMEESTISGPSVGGTVTFKQANDMFLASGKTGEFVTYENGVYKANFEHAAVVDEVNGDDVYFNLGHMLLGDPKNTLFEGGNAITVTGSGTIVFENLDVSILGDTAGSGTYGDDHTEGGNIANGLLTGTNTILGVSSGCTVTLGEGVNIKTATPVNDNSGKTVKCNALLALSGGTINIGTPAAQAASIQAASPSDGPVIDGAANVSGTGKIVVYDGIVSAAGAGVTAGSANIITARVGTQTIMGANPLDVNQVAIPASGNITVESAPSGAVLYAPESRTVQNNTNAPISVSASSTQPLKEIPAKQSSTVTAPTAKEALQLAVNNAVAQYPTTASSNYTPASWTAYQTALKAAQDLLASSGSVDDTQYQTVTTNLQNAINGLVVAGPTLNALANAITDAKALVGDNANLYPAAAWSAYQTALANAQKILDNPSGYSAAQMNGATRALQTAVDGLVQKVERFYNKWSGEHLFTTDSEEINDLLAAGWDYESVGWNAPATGTPVYRLYNPWSYDHYYTTDKEEMAGLIEDGWEPDFVVNGVQQPAFYSVTNGNIGIYQLFNPYETSGTHMWTIDPIEYEDCQNDGWVGENVKFYALSKAV